MTPLPDAEMQNRNADFGRMKHTSAVCQAACRHRYILRLTTSPVQPAKRAGHPTFRLFPSTERRMLSASFPYTEYRIRATAGKGGSVMIDGKSRRIAMMSGGVLCIGLGSGLFRHAGFGADPFTTMNLGISELLGLSFGTWQLIMNLLLFVPVLIWGRRTIGPGTAANMILIGYISDAVLFMVNGWLPQSGLSVRLILMVCAMLMASFGVACYIIPSLGVAPYDALQLMMEKYSHGRISYRSARIGCDAFCIMAGILAMILAGGDVASLIGIGTICNVLMMGPVIQFFKDRLSAAAGSSALAAAGN